MKHARPLVALATAATTALVLVGCGSDTPDHPEPADQAPAATSPATAEPNAEPHADASTDVSYDASTAIKVDLADGASKTSDDKAVAIDGDVVTITEPGTYVLSGRLTDGQVRVSTEADGEVMLVLDGASIASSSTSPLSITRAEVTTVVLADGSTNALTDGGDSDAALHSSDDLTVAGTGSLEVTGVSAGISSEKGLVVLSGDVTVEAAEDGIHGADYLVVDDGALQVSAGENALTAEKDTRDGSLGFIEVAGGTVTVADAVEGVEARSIVISGGTVDVTASEDGLNASSDTFTPSLTITGGAVEVDAEGDGIDSNGSFEMSGGEVTVAGPTSAGNGALDVDGTFLVSGGTLLASGSAGMAIAPSTESEQGWVQVAFDGTVAAGSKVSVLDADGDEVATTTLTKDAGNLVVSAPGISTGDDYTVSVDGSEVATVTAGVSTGGGPGGHGGPGGPGGDRGGSPEQMAPPSGQ